MGFSLNEIMFCNAKGKVKTDIRYGDTLYLYFKDKEFASVVNQGNVDVSPKNVTWKDDFHTLAYYVEGDDLYYAHDSKQSEGVKSRLDKLNIETGGWDVVSDVTSYDDGSTYNAVTKEWKDVAVMDKQDKPVIQYKEWESEVVFAPYMDNGNTAIQLSDPETGEHISTSTVNLGAIFPQNVVLIKDWSENEGMIDALHQAGVIKPEVISKTPTGFVNAYAYELTQEFEDERVRQYAENDLDKLADESRARAFDEDPFAEGMYLSMFGDEDEGPNLDLSDLFGGDDDGINAPELDLSDLDDDGPEL